MRIITRGDESREQVAAWRRSGATVGIVPTMGALHEGHVSLVRQSVAACNHTVVTIFVNPTQFGPQEDLSKYPRTFDADCELIRDAGADVVFAPTIDEMYPAGYSTFVEPPVIAKPLEGEFRPGHFRGVATVVLKLFGLVPATHAFFGRKDYQQFKVIEAMVRDLNVGITLVAGETVREADGLALSSRNRYLSTEERATALSLSIALSVAETLVRDGERNVSTIEHAMKRELAATKLDYARVVEAETLTTIKEITSPVVAVIATRVGTTRLIDNRLLD